MSDTQTHKQQEKESTGQDPRASQGRLAGWTEWLKIWGPVLILAIVAFGYTFTFLEPAAPKELTIASGSASGAFYGYAHRYSEILKPHGYTLTVAETAGSVDNLNRLQNGEVDLAILQGGVADPAEHPSFEAIASLFFEPLWVFHRADATYDHIIDLAGLRIAVGAEGSGTRTLALELLAQNGVDASSSELVPLSGDAAADALIAGELDAAFFVAAPSAGYIRNLLDDEGLTLLPIRRHRAYRIRYPFLSEVVLGEGVIDLDDNLPAEDVPLVAAAAALVARKDLHHALVPLLIQATQEVHDREALFKPAGYFPSDRHLDLPLKKEAAHYLEHGPSFLYRILPYRTAAVVDRLKILLLPFIPLLLIVFKMAPPLYRWRIRSKIYRWYEDLRALDLLLLRSPSATEVQQALAVVDRLEVEVTEVSVPLSYMDELYNLRIHMELVEKKLKELQDPSEPV